MESLKAYKQLLSLGETINRLKVKKVQAQAISYRIKRFSHKQLVIG